MGADSAARLARARRAVRADCEARFSGRVIASLCFIGRKTLLQNERKRDELLAPLADAMPHIINGLKLGKTPEEIYADLKENMGSLAVNVIAAVLSILFPGLGTGIGALMKVILFMHQHSVPMTQEEENKWFDRFGAGAES